MDFVTWCETLLAFIRNQASSDQNATTIGVNAELVVNTMLPATITQCPDLWESDKRVTVHHALEGMQALSLLEKRTGRYYRITQLGRQHVKNPLPLWTALCQIDLDDEYAAVLCAVNRTSIVAAPEGAYRLQDVEHDQLLAELGWGDIGFDKLYAAVAELERMGLLWQLGVIGRHVQVHSTYKGAIWNLRQGETVEAAFIDQLLADGETTSVDFKRELRLGNDNEKAEFVKDVLGLATTQASGRPWLIIGFDEKTQTFTPPGDDITLNRLEQILSDYTTPQVLVRYDVATYRGHFVGKLEVLRERAHLPYRVAKSLGGKKRIEEGDIFVRHGSQTEHPTEAEQQAIEEEGERARERQRAQED